MDLYEGDLRFHIANTDPAQYGASLVETMLEILAFLAQKGITHGDIKPANILFAQGKFYLTDFGLIETSASTQRYAISELYAAPEAHQNELTPRSDLRSLGVVILEVLKERPDFPPPLILEDQRTVYWESIQSTARNNILLTRLLSIAAANRDDAALCLERFFSNGDSTWPFRKTLVSDVEMAMEEIRPAKQRPYRVRKKPKGQEGQAC